MLYFFPVEYFVLDTVITFKAPVCIFPDFSTCILEEIYNE